MSIDRHIRFFTSFDPNAHTPIFEIGPGFSAFDKPLTGEHLFIDESPTRYAAKRREEKFYRDILTSERTGG